MKKLYLLTMLAVIFASIFTSCEKDTTDADTPKPPTAYLEIETDTVFFSSEAAENRIVAVSAIDNSWIASCEQEDATWCKVNTAKNSLGEKEIKISVQQNEDTIARECTVTVTLDAISKEFVVKQMGLKSDDATKIILEKTEYEVDFPATELTVPVVANGTFTATADVDWVSFKEQKSAEDGTVQTVFEIKANENTEPRTAKLTISSRWASTEINLTQNGYKPLYVSATEIKAGFNKDTVSVEISSAVDYTVSIEEGKSWITAVAEERQDNIVRFAVAANEFKIDRSAKITVKAGNASEIITVTQIGAKEFENLEDDGMAEDIRIPVISAQHHPTVRLPTRPTVFATETTTHSGQQTQRRLVGLRMGRDELRCRKRQHHRLYGHYTHIPCRVGAVRQHRSLCNRPRRRGDAGVGDELRTDIDRQNQNRVQSRADQTSPKYA